ncbi:MAG: 16S rRNA (cytidine(1402)-2'-O)-methyltransferase [Ignavibacteria bacterium]|nr:16S rRNA (cytidine(1402)-2'-O)-methyltransferase [Ignavibacteria bacterium]
MMDTAIYIDDFEKYFPAIKIEKGTLYIAATPIGNLDEISLRALYILKNADLIACEDTRVTSVLLNRYGIKTHMMSYYAHVESSKLDYLLDELKSGKSVAIVSDAGTPGISDPGSTVVSACVREGIDVVSIPGANALIHALVVSGFENKKFYFQGFLPIKGRENVMMFLKEIKMPIIIYESKFRIRKTISELNNYFGKKEISVSRELSKIHETTYRGTLSSVATDLNRIKEKGEFTIVLNNV